MKEYIHFDGEKDITFNVVHIDSDKQIAVIASTAEGKISVLEYEIKEDCDGEYSDIILSSLKSVCSSFVQTQPFSKL